MHLFTALFNLLQKRTHIALVFDSNGTEKSPKLYGIGTTDFKAIEQ